MLIFLLIQVQSAPLSFTSEGWKDSEGGLFKVRALLKKIHLLSLSLYIAVSSDKPLPLQLTLIYFIGGMLLLHLVMSLNS